jgi:hypothetical protein
MLTSDKTIKWVENLAEQECLIQLGEKSSLDICSVKDDVLTTETNAFIRALFYQFEYLIRLFNVKVDLPSLKIKIHSREDGGNSFTLSRNRINLIVTGTQIGVVQLQCVREEISNLSTSRVIFSGLIEARFDTFDEVQWYFLDNPISAEQVVRHYLTEFLQISRFTDIH